MRKKSRGKIWVFLPVMALAVLLAFESRPCRVYSSSIFTSQGSASIRLCVVVNSFLPVDREKVAEVVVAENIRINGPRPGAVYELELYRSEVHYRYDQSCGVIYCDANGNLLPAPIARETREWYNRRQDRMTGRTYSDEMYLSETNKAGRPDLCHRSCQRVCKGRDPLDERVFYRKRL